MYQWAVARPLWLDEEMIAINIRDRGFAALAGPLSLAQSAPYGWLIVERLALRLLGTGERVLRLFPLLFGLAAIGIALWIGRRWLGAIAASALVLLCSVSQWLTYSFVELKHYSADVCFSLLLPALAAWALETDRIVVWWVVAALVQFFSNGAVFVTPVCAAAIVIVVWRRHGPGAAVRAAVPGILWLAMFAANYVIVLRPIQTNEFLQSYWQPELPPAGAGLGGSVRWLAARLAPFAAKPAGSGAGLLLWIAAVAGFATSAGRRRLLALMFATVPLSAFLLTALHVVPFFERLVIWVIPAVYVGVALLADAATGTVRLKRDTHLTATAVALAIVALICVDVTWRGLDDLHDRPKSTHHRLDDRSAVLWLTARIQPGDVVLTTHLALPAIWWYGADKAPLFEARYEDPGPGCRPGDLARALDDFTRVLVFFGFRFDDVPKTFDDLLLHELADQGQMNAYRGFDGLSRVAIIDRRVAARHDRLPDRFGCVVIQPAQRW